MELFYNPEDEHLRAAVRLGRRMAAIHMFFFVMMLILAFIFYNLGAGAAQSDQYRTSGAFEALATKLIGFWRWLKNL